MIIVDRMCEQFGPYDKERGQQTLFNKIHRIDVMPLVWGWLENNKEIRSLSLDSLRDYFGMAKDNEGAGPFISLIIGFHKLELTTSLTWRIREHGKQTSKKKTWTEEEAEKDLIGRLDKIEGRLEKEFTEIDLPTNKREALKSLIDNTGWNNFKYKKGKKENGLTEAYKAIQKGDWEKAAHELFDEDVGFTKQGGKKLAGLVRRRKEEERLWSRFGQNF